MDFEILMEGTMIGAELQVLSEAGTVDVSKAANANDFANMVVGAIESDLNEIDTRIKAILSAAAQEKNKLKSADFSSIKADNDVIKELKGIVGVDDTATVAKTLNTSLTKLMKVATEINSGISKLKITMKSKLNDAKKEIIKNYKEADKKVAGKLGEVTIVAKSTESTAEKALTASQTLINSLTDELKNLTIPNKEGTTAYTLSQGINSLNTQIKAYNKVVKTNIGKIAGLSRLQEVNLDPTKSVVSADKKEVDKAKQQSEGALSKLKSKMKALISKISHDLNNPTIATIAISVGIAIVSYLVLYGFVKSAGEAGNIINVPGTFKNAALVIKNGSLGKKFVAIALLAITVSAFAAAGKAGYSFIKNKFANKS